MRVAVLLAHGVNAQYAREIAISQLETERAQAQSTRAMREGRDDDGAIMLAAKYDGADPGIAALFEQEMHREHKPGGSKSKCKRKYVKRRPITAFNPWEAA